MSLSRLSIRVVLAFALAGCGASEPAPIGPPGTPPSGASGSGGIKEVTLPVASGVRAGSPRFSPDGKRLAYLRWEMDEEHVAVMGADGNQSTTLAGGANYLTSFAWKSDGSALYYVGAELFEIPVAGGASTGIANAFAGMHLDLSPDGTQLVYTVNGTSNLTVVDLSVQPAATRELGQKGAFPRFSPDGTRLAFHHEAKFQVMELATGALTEIADGAHFFSSLDWFSDGQRLIIVTEAGIELLDLRATPATRKKLHDGFAVLDVDLSPDDKSLAFGVNGQAALRVLTGL